MEVSHKELFNLSRTLGRVKAELEFLEAKDAIDSDRCMELGKEERLLELRIDELKKLQVGAHCLRSLRRHV
jgi:hypothetical protein